MLSAASSGGGQSIMLNVPAKALAIDAAPLPAVRPAPAATTDRPTRAALRDLLNIVFFYRRVALAVVAAIVAIAVIAAVLMPARYTAHAQLLALAADVYDMQTQGANAATQKILDPSVIANVEMQLLSSTELHRAVVRHQLGASADPATVDAAVLKFEKNLHVTKVADANVIDLAYTARTAADAASTLQTLLDEYLAQRANILTGGRLEFLTRQRDAAKGKLDSADAQIAAYQRSNGIVDIAAQVADAVRLNGLLHQQREETNAALADSRSAIARMQSDNAGQPRQVELYSDNTEAARSLGEMQQTLLALRAKRSDLASRYMAGSPQVAQVDKQIAGIQQALKAQQAELVTTRRLGRNDSYYSARDRLDQARASAAGAAARAGALRGQVDQSDGKLKALIGVSDVLTRMRIQRDVLAESYRSLAAQVEQARVQLNLSSASGGTNVRVVEAPTPPLQRSNPPLLLIAGGIVAGLALAGATVFVMASVRETFVTVDELEHAFRVPVLAAPVAGEDGDAPRAFGRLTGAINTLPRQNWRSVLLLSPQSRRAARDAALSLGRAIARRAEHRVILLRFATDAPPPGEDGQIEIQMLDGMATAVVDIASCLHYRMDDHMLAGLGQHYDTIIITAPPTIECFESVELSRVADLVVAVVEAEKTRATVIRELFQQVEEIGARVAGIVMAGRRQHIPHRLYRALFD